jgi:hypothetical protein
MTRHVVAEGAPLFQHFLEKFPGQPPAESLDMKSYIQPSTTAIASMFIPSPAADPQTRDEEWDNYRCGP